VCPNMAFPPSSLTSHDTTNSAGDNTTSKHDAAAISKVRLISVLTRRLAAPLPGRVWPYRLP
jgi:hypothetical protein